jgi:plastocyanin
MRYCVVFLCVVAVAVIAAGCTQPSPPQPPQATLTVSPAVPVQTLITPVPTPISQASVSGNTITIKNFAFTPRTMTVKTGSIVRWENKDSIPHRIIFIDKDGQDTPVDSSVLSSTQSWSKKFDQPGTYPYYCKIHPEMTGTVIVE